MWYQHGAFCIHYQNVWWASVGISGENRNTFSITFHIHKLVEIRADKVWTGEKKTAEKRMQFGCVFYAKIAEPNLRWNVEMKNTQSGREKKKVQFLIRHRTICQLNLSTLFPIHAVYILNSEYIIYIYKIVCTVHTRHRSYSCVL